MKKFKILSIIYTALWIAFFLIAVIGRITYNESSADPLDAYMDKGIYNIFILVAASGLLSALSSLFSALLNSKTQTRLTRAAFALSIITNVLFVISFVLLFLINKDWIVFAPIIWVISLVACLIILVVSKITRSNKGAIISNEE